MIVGAGYKLDESELALDRLAREGDVQKSHLMAENWNRPLPENQRKMNDYSLPPSP